MSRHACVAALLVVVLAGCGADDSSGGARPDAGDFGRGQVALVGPDGERRVDMDVYVADREELWRRGLMGWESLPEGEGMLFAFDEDRDGGFWMKDTLLELSVAFADADGRIHDIQRMQPCREEPCPTYRPEEPYRYALEVEQGAFAAIGVVPEWRIEVTDALR